MLRQDVTLQIQQLSRFSSPQCRVVIRVRDHGHRYDIGSDVSHRQTDSIDRDRPLLDQVSLQVHGNSHLHPPILIAQRFERDQLANAVDMALHNVSAQPV